MIKIKRKLHLRKLRKRLKNKNVTIISNNCAAGFIYHDLGCKFLTPTINLYIRTDEFVVFAKNLRYYLSCEMEEYYDSSKSFPMGKLKAKDKEHQDIILNFNHYNNFEEAKGKWIERSKRVNYDNLCVIMEFYDDVYSEKLLDDFQEIPFSNKIILTHKSYPDRSYIFPVHCYQDNEPRGKLFEINEKTGKRYLDEFDYVTFINKTINKKKGDRNENSNNRS